MLKKIFGYGVLVSISFFSGCIYKGLDFVYSDVNVLKESINIVSATKQEGVFPAGTEFHYQSMAHNEVHYYTFVTVPLDVAKKKIERQPEDRASGGIKRLRGGFE